MSEPTSVTVRGRTFDVLESQPMDGDIWTVTIDDTEHWIGPRNPTADAVLHFGDHDRAGSATLDGITWLTEPLGTVHVTLTVTAQPA
jgi:hypothetical protein